MLGEGGGFQPIHYPVATFYAASMGEDGYAEYYGRYYPELVYLNGMLYGGTNEWMSCRERGFLTDAYFCWDLYPQAIRDYFTHEQVQELVDSYQVMLTAEELHAGLDRFLEETEQEN